MYIKGIIALVGLIVLLFLRLYKIFSKVHYWRSGPANKQGKQRNVYENTVKEGTATSGRAGVSGSSMGSGGISVEIKGKRIRTNGVIPANEKIVICRYCGVENSIPENGGECRCYFCREII
ncbi:MAG: hypothetical protein ACI4DW_11150 [Lachnospiraceae bacterium]